jgi:hypothetical protein
VVALPEAVARERVERGLQVRGFTIQGRGRPVTAVDTGPVSRGWADCPMLLLADPARRASRTARVAASEVTTRVWVDVAAVSATDTRIAVRARHSGLYVDRFTSTPEPRLCASTGTLERSLLDALRL